MFYLFLTFSPLVRSDELRSHICNTLQNLLAENAEAKNPFHIQVSCQIAALCLACAHLDWNEKAKLRFSRGIKLLFDIFKTMLDIYSQVEDPIQENFILVFIETTLFWMVAVKADKHVDYNGRVFWELVLNEVCFALFFYTIESS